MSEQNQHIWVSREVLNNANYIDENKKCPELNIGKFIKLNANLISILMYETNNALENLIKTYITNNIVTQEYDNGDGPFIYSFIDGTLVGYDIKMFIDDKTMSKYNEFNFKNNHCKSCNTYEKVDLDSLIEEYDIDFCIDTVTNELANIIRYDRRFDIREEHCKINWTNFDSNDSLMIKLIKIFFQINLR